MPEPSKAPAGTMLDRSPFVVIESIIRTILNLAPDIRDARDMQEGAPASCRVPRPPAPHARPNGGRRSRLRRRTKRRRVSLPRGRTP